MSTNGLQRAETRSVSIAASPQAVLELVTDPRALPRWAPGFAPSIRPDGEDWVIDSDGEQARIRLVVSREHGTVDFRSATNPRRGAFSRVLPNHEGSEYLFTLLFAKDTPEQAVKHQMSIVETELRTVRQLCESDSPRPAR